MSTTSRAAPAASPTHRPALESVRVAMVTARFHPQLGGTETHVDEVAGRIAGRGLDVTVLTTDLSGRLPAVERHGAFVVHRFPARPRRTDLYASPGLARAVTRGDYDLVHLQGVHTLLPPMVLAAARRAGIPTVVTFHTGGHSSRLRSAFRGAQWRAIGPLLRRADALVAVSSHERELFARHLDLDPASIRLVPNGAEPLPSDDREPVASGAPLICSIGRLERYKGHHRLIAAMPALLTAEPGAHLVVVGRGPYEGRLRRLAVRLGVERAVTFTAFAPEDRAGMGTLIRSSDVVALLSDYEAHPVALAEALALGKKVVAAETSGLSELARDRDVTAVPLDVRPAVLAAALARASAAPDVAPGPLRTWDDCAQDVLAIYGEVVGARS